MDLESIFTFGKYEGEQLEDIIIDDPFYIEYLYLLGSIPFSDDALELMRKRKII